MMRGEESRCLFCRSSAGIPIIQHCTKRHRTSSHGVTASFNKWGYNCIQSVANLFNIPAGHPFYYVFENASVCGVCRGRMEDIDLTLRQLGCLLKRLELRREQLYESMKNNYEMIPDKESYTVSYQDVENGKGWRKRETMDYNQVIKIMFEKFTDDIVYVNNALEQFKLIVPLQDENRKATPRNVIQPNISALKLNCLGPEPILDVNMELDLDLDLEIQPSYSSIDEDFPNIKMEVTEQSEEHAGRRSFTIDNTKFHGNKMKNVETKTNDSEGDNNEDAGMNSVAGSLDPSEAEWSEEEARTKRIKKLKTKSEAEIISNSKKRNIFQCQIESCDGQFRQFLSAERLRIHQRRVHGILVRPDNAEERKIVCPVESCNSRFHTESRLRVHLRRIHGNKKRKNKKVLTCAKCPATFQTEENLQRHIGDEDNEEQQYFCSICSSGFSSDCSFQQHNSKLHTATAATMPASKNLRPRRSLAITKVKLERKKIKEHTTVSESDVELNSEIENISTPVLQDTISNVKNQREDEDPDWHSTVESPQTDQNSESSDSEWSENEHKRERVAKRKAKTTINLDKDKAEKGAFQCKVENCDHRFGTSERLRTHQRRAHGILVRPDNAEERKIHCPVESCNSRFHTESRLRVHQRRIHGKEYKTMLCPKCPARFKTETGLQAHIDQHDEQYFCTICNIGCTSERNFERHNKEMHSNDKLSCSFCALVCNTEEELLSHEDLHKNKEQPFSCTVCETVCTNSYTLKKHVQTIHLDKLKFCDICGKGFTKQYTFAAHKLTHDPSYVGFPCTVCSYKAKNKAMLEAHMHKHSESRSFICEVCGKTFKYPRGLKFHMRNHTNDFKFSCKLCGKKFAGPTFLHNHEETHAGTKTYQCSKCPSMFKSNMSLKQHEKTHLPKDPNKPPRTRKPKPSISKNPEYSVSFMRLEAF